MCLKKKIIMNKYAYILVEVGKREFESRLLLKRELEKEGFIVIIGLKNILIDLLVLSVFPQGIIFDKCAQFATNWRIKRLKKKGFIYTCLDEEGIFTKLPEVKSRNTDLTNVDYLFLNNKKHFNLVMQANPNGLSSEKILISGNPRQLVQLGLLGGLWPKPVQQATGLTMAVNPLSRSGAGNSWWRINGALTLRSVP